MSSETVTAPSSSAAPQQQAPAGASHATTAPHAASGTSRPAGSGAPRPAGSGAASTSGRPATSGGVSRAGTPSASRTAVSSKPQAAAASQSAASGGSLPLPAVIAAAGTLAVGGALVLWRLLRKKGSKQGGQGARAGAVGADGKPVKGPCSGLKPTAKCVPLADGSACVIRREIPADNSCLFNAIGYCMHGGSRNKASFLRSVVAQEVSSDPEAYNSGFLGMSNVAYCSWIMNPVNWGGGIELAILARHYGREIAAWDIEACKQHVFGEDAGHPRRVMVIYNGVHYDALAIAKSPRAPESEDKTEFNPRTKSGKMALAAAQKLVELSHRGSKFFKPGQAKKKSAADGMRMRCADCSTTLAGQAEAAAHAKATGHTKFEQVK